MGDKSKPCRARRKLLMLLMLLMLLGVGAAAWVVRSRIRDGHRLDNGRQHLPAAPRPTSAAIPASAAADTAPASFSAASPKPVAAGPGSGVATGPAAEPELGAIPDHLVKPAAATPTLSQRDSAQPALPTSAAASPALPKPGPDQPADAEHPARSGAASAAGARASGTGAALADPPFGPGSVRARSDGSSPDPTYVVKGKAATKAFYTPAGLYYTRTRADVWFRSADDARAAGFTERAPRRRR